MIQSVLDVKDDAAPPKHSNALTVFNRSILILTPARALKFTAPSKERHYVWLTALSFLSRPSLGDNELASLPPPLPRQELDGLMRPPAPALRRNPIRDSIRVAKGKSRPGTSKASVPSHLGPVSQDSLSGRDDKLVSADALVAAADPPTVPRFSSHGRHRSNTGGRPPLGAIRSFTNPVISSNQSVATNASSDYYGTGSSQGGRGLNSGPSSVTYKSSDVSSHNVLPTSNFFDAVGTVRMEAFVKGSPPLQLGDDRQKYAPNAPPAMQVENWKGRFSHDNPDLLSHRFEDGDDFFRLNDPFRGF